MRSFLTLGNAMLLTILAGCATEWSRPNTTEAELAQDRLKCEQQADVAYPPKFASSGTGYQAPVQTNCTTYGIQGHCSTPAGIQVPLRQNDVNAAPRSNAVDACLRANGYVLQP